MSPQISEHACRLLPPEDVNIIGSRERQHEGKTYRILFGTPKRGGEAKSVEQTYRYPITEWTEAAARAHCKAHNGILFEPAESNKVKTAAEKLRKAIKK